MSFRAVGQEPGRSGHDARANLAISLPHIARPERFNVDGELISFNISTLKYQAEILINAFALHTTHINSTNRSTLSLRYCYCFTRSYYVINKKHNDGLGYNTGKSNENIFSFGTYHPTVRMLISPPRQYARYQAILSLQDGDVCRYSRHTADPYAINVGKTIAGKFTGSGMSVITLSIRCTAPEL